MACSNRVFAFTGITGGAAGDLDDLRYAHISNGDIGVVITSADEVYVYSFDSTSSASESDPDVIAPDDVGSNTGRWLLVWTSLRTGELPDAKEWTAQQNFNEAAITSTSNSVAWNLDTAQCAVHTMTENTTIAAPTNMNAGGHYTLRVVQGAGPYTLAWNAAFDWGAATTPDAPAANGDVIIFSFYSDGTTMYGVEAIVKEA